MASARLRLTVAALLFVAWIGWLVYLVANTRHTIVLSQPQFLVSSVYVIADVKSGQDSAHPDPLVKVDEAGWSAEAEKLKSTELTVRGLDNVGSQQGWAGPGKYILPLTESFDGQYAVTPLPRSPGFPGGERLRIYLANFETRAQLKELASQRPR